MRILIANNFFSPEGGAELSALLTFRLLKENGHEVAFFATDKQPYFIQDYPYASYFPKFTEYDEVRGLSAKLKSVPGIFYKREAELNLSAMLRDFEPEIVHCNNLHYHLTPSVLKACRDYAVPVLMTLRDVRLMCPAGTLMRGNETYCGEELCINGSALNCITHRCYSKSLLHSGLATTEYYFRKIHRLYDSVARFIAPSVAIRDLAVRSGIPSEKLTVINNFIDNEFFATHPNYQPGRYFLFVGRLSREKGVHTLIDAVSRLPKNVELHIVGTGPDEKSLKRQAENLGLTNIKFLGFLAGQALQDEYHHCLATVVPSNWFENFSRTVIESVASGKPVIGSRIGGIQEVVEHEETGLLCTPGDTEELAEALLKLYRQPELAVQLGQNAREKAECFYNANVYLEKTLTAYREVLSCSQGSETQVNAIPILEPGLSRGQG